MEIKSTEYIWILDFLLTTLRLVGYFILHLQEGDVLMSCTFKKETPFGNEIYLSSIMGHVVLDYI